MAKVTKTEETTALVVPEYGEIIGVDSDAAGGSLISPVAQAIPRISLRRRKFTLIRDEVEVVKPAESILGTILHAAPAAGLYCKTYFDKPYVAGQTVKPACASSDGVKPDSWCTDPQAAGCAQCPMNQFGSAKSRLGKDSKACKDSKRLFVTVVDDPGEIYLLQIPQSSCKNLTNLGVRIRAGVKNASGQIVRFPMQAYQVRFSMDEDADFPIVQFSIDKVLDKEAYDEMMKLKELRPWASAEEQAASWYE